MPTQAIDDILKRLDSAGENPTNPTNPPTPTQGQNPTSGIDDILKRLDEADGKRNLAVKSETGQSIPPEEGIFSKAIKSAGQFLQEQVISETDRAVLQALQGNPDDLKRLAQEGRQKISDNRGAIADFIASTGGDIAGTTGGAIAGAKGGAILGSAFGPVGTAIGGTVGGIAGSLAGGGLLAPAGLAISRYLRGEEVTQGELILEGVASALPGVATEAVKGGARLIRGTKGVARTVSHPIKDLEVRGAEKLRSIADEDAFNPLKEQSAQLFDIVRGSGARLDSEDFVRGLKQLDDKEFSRVVRRISNIEPPPNNRIPGYGRHFAEEITKIRDGKAVGGLDIGALQHVRSRLLKLGLKGTDESAAIDFFIDRLDDIVNNGRFVDGVSEASETLLKARKLAREAFEIEEIGTFLRSVTPRNKAGELTINLGKLVENLNNPSGKVALRARKALDRQPGRLAEIQEFAKNIKPFIVKQDGVKIPQAGILSQSLLGIANLLSNRQTRAEFNQLILKNSQQSPTGQRFITLNQIRFLVNAARRGTLGTGEGSLGDSRLPPQFQRQQ